MDILSRSSEGTKFKGYVLHPFQEEAIAHVEKDKSVIVSTHTGNGKTLVAESGIESCINDGKKIVYTAPIKALSNQKLKQFSSEKEQEYINQKYDHLREKYGDKLVGLVTGDRTINPDAPIVLMTTEVLCNMLYDNPDQIEDIVKYIVFDEIHNLADPERGTIWEETIILKPKNCKIIGLSATAPNSKELCEWVGSLDEEEVYDVTYNDRLTPLTYSYFHKDYGSIDGQELKNKLNGIPKEKRPFTTHMDFIKYAQKNELLNVLGFFSSRKKCEGYAQELSNEFNFLDKKQRHQVESILFEYNSKYPDLANIKSWQTFEQTARNGITFYHSGLIPIMKDACEELLNSNLSKVCYGTDAISQGVNLAFKTVFMESLIDGYTRETVSGAVFKQRAGRAGRKGFDESGNVFVLANVVEEDIVDLSKIDGENVDSKLALPFNRVIKHSQRDIDSFFARSFKSFQHSYKIKKLENEKNELYEQLSAEKKTISDSNSCKSYDKAECPLKHKELKNDLNQLNYMLTKCSTDEERNEVLPLVRTVEELLSQSLRPIRCLNMKPCTKQNRKLSDIENKIANVQHSIDEVKINNPIDEMKLEYNNKIELLKHMNYIDDNNNLLYKGQMCSNIYIEELLVSELIADGLFYEYDVDTINAYLAGIVFEHNKKIETQLGLEFDTKVIEKKINYIAEQAKQLNIEYTPNLNKNICSLMHKWSMGDTLPSIIEKCDIFEGDFINVCKNVVNLLTQIQRACANDEYTVSKASECIGKIKRDIVALSF